jgi:DNA invertase Pin-like site-specific DNA recombinase
MLENEMTKMRFIVYYRISPRKKHTGLGLEAQQQTAHAFVKQNGGIIVAEYQEIETGKRSNRPELQKAIAHCRSANCTLLIAKLDRLARNVAFTSALMEAGVEFICCDNPHANRFTIHILAAVAENEARQIAQRTREALAAAKKRGVKLGSQREGHWKPGQERPGWRQGLKVAHSERKKRTAGHYEFIMPRIEEWRKAGRTLDEIVELLNSEGHLTTAGKPFSGTAVWRLIKRYLSDDLLGKAYQVVERQEAVVGETA